MTQSFFVPGPLPGMNDFAGKKSRWAYTALKASWGQTIGWRIVQAKLKPMKRAVVGFRWMEANKKRDPDNVCTGAKFVLDALVSQKILPGDGWKAIAGLTHAFAVDASNPGVLITLERPR